MTNLAHPDRTAKIEAMRAEGVDPYPARGVDATPIADLLKDVGTAEAPGPAIGLSLIHI